MDRYRELSRLGVRALRGEPLADVSQAACELLAQVLGARRVGAFNLLPDRRTLHLVAGAGLPAAHIGQTAIALGSAPELEAALQAAGASRVALPGPPFDGGGPGTSMPMRTHSEAVGLLVVDLPEVADAELVEAAAALLAAASDAHRREDDARQHGLRDVLTGLPNWLLLLDRLTQSLKRSKRQRGLVAVIALDVDELRAFNQQYGIDAGNRLLEAVAHRAAVAVRAHDTVARIEGDTFVILCEDVTGVVEATAIAGRVHATVGGPPTPDKAHVTASVGIAVSAGDTEPPEVLLDRAKGAMADAIRAGGDRVVVARQPRA